MTMNYLIIPGLNKQPTEYTYEMFLWDFTYASGFTYEELRSKSRTRPVTQYRQMAMSLMVKNFKMTKAEIGRLFNRDHATCIHAEKIVANREYDIEFRENYNVLITRLIKKSGRPIKS